ncbi:EAL domain-containing protein [Enterobacter sp. Bisph1]|uniref:EAL domain-containing protein n=1 Tax=Enterobacter sp. Bisph1 TaxID=1274399 RepID=UPI000690200B|nr:EAL domain-containing protein [Enterobacter sp. Bisph1]
MTAEFHPAMHISTQTILRYHATAQFFNTHGFLIPPSQKNEFLEDPVALRNVSTYICDAVFHALKMKEDITVALPLAPAMINDADYFTELYQRCRVNSVAPSRIDIEVSDRLSSAQFFRCLPFLKRAKEYGFTLSLGEYGSGTVHTESRHLFPFDSVTLARSVTDGISLAGAKRSLLHRFLDTLTPVGTPILCAGVDRASDLALLSQYRHRGIQGHTLSRSLTWTQLQLLEGM